MPRESSKCREWEKERRNRLNEAFITLCKLLPCYDPAVNTSKIDILRNAASYIQELQTKIKDLMSSNTEESVKKVKGDELKKLQERIKRLLGKNEQLCCLLREAKITIPPGCGVVKKFKNPLFWSNRILPEQAKILQKKEAEKENNVSASKAQGRKFNNKSKGMQGGTPKHRKAILNRPETKKLRGKRKKGTKVLAPSKCVIVLSQPSITQSCYVITNAPSNNNILRSSSTVITNSSLLTNPLVSSSTNKGQKSITLPSLGPGTLILANGTIVPVVPPPTVLPITPQIIPNPRPNPTVILLSKNPVSCTNNTRHTSTKDNVNSCVKTLARIKPKYCLTRTTQVNKVPIPALTSRYSNNEIITKNTEKKTTRISEKKQEKKAQAPKNVEKRKIEENSDINDAKKAKNCDSEEVVVKERPEPPPASPPSMPSPPKITKDTDLPMEKPVELPPPPPCPPTPPPPIVPIEEKEKNNDLKKSDLDLNINHSELSNDIFASLQVPAGCQNPESTSPTAAFLLAFPLVSSLTGVKVTEVTEEDNSESQRGTPTLLQIGTMDTTKPTQSESLTPSILNLDNLSFFSTKEMTNFYNSFDNSNSVTTTTTTPTVITTTATLAPPSEKKVELLTKKINYQANNKSELASCFENNAILSNNELNYQIKNKTNGTNYQKSFNCQNFSDTLKVGTACTYASSIKTYPEPLYTNSNSYSYNYPSTEINSNQNYYKNITKNDNRSYYSLNYENYSDYSRKNDVNFAGASNCYPNTQNNTNNVNKGKNSTVSHSRPPINWMTTPDNRTDYGLLQINKENDLTHNYPQYFTNNPVYNEHQQQECRKGTSIDLPLMPPVNSYQRQEMEENQFSWSPTKLPQYLDPPHTFVSSTLPTLVGDLALGNTLNFEQKTNLKKDSGRRLKFENQNFLSVSQLVDHNSKNEATAAARTSARRNSGSRMPNNTNSNKKVAPSVKSGTNKRDVVSAKSVNEISRNLGKSNNYSAEALIGHQIQNVEGQKRQQNYSSSSSNNKTMSVSSFLHDNIIPYFPAAVDLPQDNYNIQQNQNYQGSSFSHNFSSTFQNNSYNNTFIPAATTITSNNFMHDMHDYSDNLNLFPPPPPSNKDKNYNKNVNKSHHQQAMPSCPTSSSSVSVNAKKTSSSKKKHSNEATNLPNFVDFPFLSMPGSINSPILPDDFHTHSGFLQPPTPQIYPCKNPLYTTKANDLPSSSLLPPLPVPGSRNNIQHPEISPSINSAGTSLTNFNLSTIFPEINNKASKSAVPNYADARLRSYTSSVQVSFNDKPTFSFSYINNCSTTQPYNNHHQ